ncbi:MAG: hypothetical protein JXA87_01200 [Thermoleophilia bacterium]|nr:hypothetical protein [Thermoleophilia bacterium]
MGVPVSERLRNHRGLLLVAVGVLLIVIGLALGSGAWTIGAPLWAGIIAISLGAYFCSRRRGKTLKPAVQLGGGLLLLTAGIALVPFALWLAQGPAWMWVVAGVVVTLAGIFLLGLYREGYITEDDTGQRKPLKTDLAHWFDFFR